MTKFGGVISKARAAKKNSEEESQKTEKSQDQKATKPENQIGESETILDAPAISNSNNDKASVEVISEESSAEPFVNLSIRVPRRMRQHWAAEAKRSGTTLTKVVSEALNQKFGEP